MQINNSGGGKKIINRIKNHLLDMANIMSSGLAFSRAWCGRDTWFF